MRVRAMDANGDMTFGQGSANFLQDSPEAVAQVVNTRLGLLLAEWFLDTTDGTPWATEVLGKYTDATRNLAITDRILGSPGVVSLDAFSCTLDPNTRRYGVAGTITTAYGSTEIEATQPANVL